MSSFIFRPQAAPFVPRQQSIDGTPSVVAQTTNTSAPEQNGLGTITKSFTPREGSIDGTSSFVPRPSNTWAQDCNRFQTVVTGCCIMPKVPYEHEFREIPPRNTVVPEHCTYRPNISERMARLPKQMKYTPMRQQSDENQASIKNIWELSEDEVKPLVMKQRIRHDAGGQNLPEETVKALTKLFAPQALKKALDLGIGAEVENEMPHLPANRPLTGIESTNVQELRDALDYFQKRLEVLGGFILGMGIYVLLLKSFHSSRDLYNVYMVVCFEADYFTMVLVRNGKIAAYNIQTEFLAIVFVCIAGIAVGITVVFDFMNVCNIRIEISHRGTI
ncbi:hypothetical protein DFH27DRAFT_524205 [Peziza echinospora]|nr:hypothetical protein DFH27DRAFT_524205 [Peziza echinospora]